MSFLDLVHENDQVSQSGEKEDQFATPLFAVDVNHPTRLLRNKGWSTTILELAISHKDEVICLLHGSASADGKIKGGD
jgi:hypothetical protein